MKLAIVIGLACAAGCGSPSPTAPDSMPPPTDARSDMVENTVSDQAGAPVANATVCVVDHAEIPCAHTDASGAYQITLPDLQGQRIAIVATAVDHLGDVELETEPVDHDGLHLTIWPGLSVQTNAFALARWGTASGFTYPGEGTGFLLVRVSGGTVGTSLDATVSISPASGHGPVYWDASGPNPALTATTATGAASFGNLAPGTYAITVTAAQKTCTVIGKGGPLVGDWAPTGGGTTDVRIMADALTQGVTVVCQ